MESKYTIKSGGVLFLIVFAGIILLSNQAGVKKELPVYFSADSAFHAGDYQKAQGFFASIEIDLPQFYTQNPNFNFKHAYTLFRLGKWQAAVEKFNQVISAKTEISDYALYFSALASLGEQNNLEAYHKIKLLRQTYKKSALLSLSDSLLARYFEKANDADSSIYYYKRMLRWGSFDNSAIYPRLIALYLKSDNKVKFQKAAFEFLNNYPFHIDAEKNYPKLVRSFPEKIPKKELRRLLKYLSKNRSILTAGKLIERQKKYAKTRAEKEYFEWLPVSLQYRDGQYKRVLDWCLKNRSKIKSFEVLQNIDLTIPRCYLRLGKQNNSIKTYLKFAELYPGHSLVNEIFWKVGWLYEESEKYGKAISVYNKLINLRNGKRKFHDEAAFRIGLNYFRLKKYNKALDAFFIAKSRTKDVSMESRINYWISKIFLLQQKMDQYWPLMFRLAERPVDSYYNLKAFFIVDAKSNTGDGVRKIIWELHQDEETHIAEYLDKFRKILLIEDLLGKRWSHRELARLKSNRGKWKEVFALGELHQRLGNYGKAYRNFRSIFTTWYLDSNLADMLHIFKKLYPFYYSDLIREMQQKYNVESEFVLSVIKKESAFEAKIVSYANAYGLMQIIPPTASQIAPKVQMRFRDPKELYTPSTNIKMGMYYLMDLLKRYKGNQYMALAAYNAGPHRVDRWIKNFDTNDTDLFIEDIEFEQTRRYVRTCMKYYWIYKLITDPQYQAAF